MRNNLSHRKPESLMGQLRSIAVGAAKEFRTPEGKTKDQFRHILQSSISQVKEQLPRKFSTSQTPDGVRVTRVE